MMMQSAAAGMKDALQVYMHQAQAGAMARMSLDEATSWITHGQESGPGYSVADAWNHMMMPSEGRRLVESRVDCLKWKTTSNGLVKVRSNCDVPGLVNDAWQPLVERYPQQTDRCVFHLDSVIVVSCRARTANLCHQEA